MDVSRSIYLVPNTALLLSHNYYLQMIIISVYKNVDIDSATLKLLTKDSTLALRNKVNTV